MNLVPDRIRFLLDEHIQKAVVQGLKQRGADAISVQDAGRAGFSDVDQLQYAISEKRVIVTFDSDFLKLVAAGNEHTGIIWCPASKYSIGQLVHRLMLAHAVLSLEAMRNHVEYL
jgi:predicted nuclease of predicted toxin-antitoxin system